MAWTPPVPASLAYGVYLPSLWQEGFGQNLSQIFTAVLPGTGAMEFLLILKLNIYKHLYALSQEFQNQIKVVSSRQTQEKRNHGC